MSSIPSPSKVEGLETPTTLPSWWVWKFGGSSVANYERMMTVVGLVNDQLEQWSEPSAERSTKSFLAASPSSAMSRQTSYVVPPVTVCGDSPHSKGVSVPVETDHLAIISSAVGGVTDLLSNSIHTALTVSTAAGIATASRYSSQNFEANPKPREHFLDDAQSELRQWAPLTEPLAVHLQNCLHSHIYGAPLMRVFNIHMDIMDKIEQNQISEGTTYHDEILRFKKFFIRDLVDIACILQSVAITGTVSDPLASRVLGQGEVWAVGILHILLSKSIEEGHTNIIALQLNAREVLTLRRTVTPGDDLRPPMVQRRSGGKPRVPTNLGDCSTADKVSFDKVSYNPSSALLEEATIKHGSVEDGGDEVINQTEEYAIGANEGEVEKKEESEHIATWAFPAWKSLTAHLYPPSGPVSVIRNDADHGGLPVIDWQVSYHQLAQWFKNETEKKLIAKFGKRAYMSEQENRSAVKPVRYVFLITGYICKTLDGLPATLQRNGSDTSAVAFASLLRAQGVTIWSDVAGVYTGDPRYVSDAYPLEYLSYEEAIELAGIGAKVLHPASLLPCMHMKMPMLLKSTFHPEEKGTLIADFSHLRDENHYGKVVCKVSDVALLTLSNYPLMSVYRFASRFFETVERGGGKILLISQGASSSAISVVLPVSEVDGVLCAVQEEFRHDVEDFGRHLKVTVDPNCTVLSVVGRGQSGYVGALASWCTALKDNNISIKAISQSSNELSTTFVVCKSQELAGQSALHSVVTSVTRKKLACTEVSRKLTDCDTPTTKAAEEFDSKVMVDAA
eukprot:Blabericola_migrator_1__3516@NODE_2042_length_3377_cov_255_838369_g1275_i1_p1_GENE_NODE_2042_length_3377_cov_255_838369_g1275_i1NODE_2042_length_3377_cov_255_838369_g1275_i1_p1_ORF_typecomplete_len791_score177_38AA_kinase/PF00696_28/0_097AA_kinase/PF00696_28/2e22ACT_7/PF13840_6/4_3ACT_7/PF13840_6/4_9e06ACT/PF01842_25/0_071_NODE_2042_length_3377_cov_255_838369_g1275_i19173289